MDEQNTPKMNPESADAQTQRRSLLRMAAASAGLAALTGPLLSACGGGGEDVREDALAVRKTKMDTPTLSCGTAGKAYIDIVVTAGIVTGAPAGFSLQWMTEADYLANNSTWYASDDPRLCKASFSGNANISRYNLAAGASVTVRVGEFLMDNGASTNCGSALQCGTTYVFRAFAHATSTLGRSDFTADLSCATVSCLEGLGGCTYTQGYWKTHGAAGPASEKLVDPVTGAITYVSVWPVASLTLGTVSYTAAQLQAIFDTASQGNGLLILAHQLIAAKLNVANGATLPADVAAAIAAADALIGSLVVPPIGSGSLKPGAVSALSSLLDAYNNGMLGVPHCR